MRQIFSLLFLWIFFAQALGISADLGEVGVGARPLSMGKAYAAVASDASAIFMNPAGLALDPALKITSMTGKLLQDVAYVSLGAAYPFNVGTLGIGYINAGIAGIPLTTLTSTATQDIITQLGVTDYSSSILYLSFGKELMPGISAGTTFKVFTQGFSQNTGSLDGANGIGTDMDFGVLVKPRKQITVGAVLQNILPASFLGKFTWKKGSVEEGIPSSLKVGVLANLIGRDGFYKYKDQEFSLSLDSEVKPKQNRPGLWHVGCEWGPTEYLFIRAGIDQIAKAAEAGVGVDNNLTAGIGLRYKGFSFDYAYHCYGDLTDNSTHFFSLGYNGAGEKPETILKKVKEAKEEKEEQMPTTNIKTKSGIKSFSDVSEGYWAKDAIKYLTTLGMLTGYPDDTFRPEEALTRAEIAVMLVKAKGFNPVRPEADLFRDVPAKHWAAPYINIALQRNYISGYPDETFMPWKKITRAEAVTVMARFAGLTEPIMITENPFPDVQKRHWAARAISVAKNYGLLEYLSGRDFEPDKPLTRAEAAEMISKTDFAKQKIKELLINNK